MKKNNKDGRVMEWDTGIIHYAHKPDPATHALATPIWQTAAYGYESAEAFDQACTEWDYIYSRENNPTWTELQRKIANLDCTEKAVVCSSGMGAIISTFLTILQAGDHVIAANGLFSHTTLFLKKCLTKFNIKVDFVDATNINEIKSALREQTKIVFVESPLNPSLRLVDLQQVSALKKDHPFIFIVDSTFAPNPIQNAAALGADLTIHSLTKIINGHGDALGGSVSGTKTLVDQIEYPGMACYTGSNMSPFNAWLILRGMQTLDVRLKKMCESAQRIAEFISEQQSVEYVSYPNLPSHPDYKLCQTQMHGNGGFVISFRFKESVNNWTAADLAKQFINQLVFFTRATSLGENHSLIQISADNALIRIAIGLENADDLVKDLDHGFSLINNHVIENTKASLKQKRCI